MNVVQKTAVFVLLVLAAQAGNNTGSLDVEVRGCENNDGCVRIALANSQENFESSEEAFRGLALQIEDGVARVRFEELPYGNYAIKVYHDEDDDGELDTNFLGIPSESYGFSNDAPAKFGPASWEDASFFVDAPADTIIINVD